MSSGGYSPTWRSTGLVFEIGQIYGNPWFAIVPYNMYSCDGLLRHLGGALGVPLSGACAQAFLRHDVSQGWLRMVRANLCMMSPPAALAIFRMEHPIPRRYALPYSSKDCIYPFGDPHITQPTDLLWSPTQQRVQGETVEPWQNELMIDFIRRHGSSEYQIEGMRCRCDRPHFYFSKGWWMCPLCRRDNGWRPPRTILSTA